MIFINGGNQNNQNSELNLVEQNFNDIVYQHCHVNGFLLTVNCVS